MKITFTRSGGFAGLELRCTLDLAELRPEEAARLQGAVDSSRILELEPGGVPLEAYGAPDAMTYHVSIERAGVTRDWTFTDLTVPTELRPLLEVLEERASAR